MAIGAPVVMVARLLVLLALFACSVSFAGVDCSAGPQWADAGGYTSGQPSASAACTAVAEAKVISGMLAGANSCVLGDGSVALVFDACQPLAGGVSFPDIFNIDADGGAQVGLALFTVMALAFVFRLFRRMLEESDIPRYGDE